eukprot:gene28356-37287_t
MNLFEQKRRSHFVGLGFLFYDPETDKLMARNKVKLDVFAILTHTTNEELAMLGEELNKLKARGASQYFTVPLNVYSLSVTLNGAAGGVDYCNNAYDSGYGGIVQADITVTPQSTLCIRVGGQGSSRPSGCTVSGSLAGGFNGGGASGGGLPEPDYNPYTSGAGGGGASDIRLDCSDYSTVIVVAGGGGGVKNGCSSNSANNGGYPGGQFVEVCNLDYSPAQQGSQTAGGTYGTCKYGTSSAGSAGQGGNGNVDYGGGGGGGYFGGAGGCDTIGAGGSSYCTYYVLSPSRRFYECILCSPGYFSSAANVSACEPCLLNSFADSFGAAACTLCPAGYVSGSTGGTSQIVCVNPIVNFSFGIFSLCLSFMAVFVYIILGRVQRIAFERRRWLVEKCMILYGIVMEVVDEVRCVVRAVAAMEESAKDKASTRSSSSSSIRKSTVGFSSSILRWISFAVFAALAAVAVVAETIFVATLHVLTNGLLLYRAYRSQDSSLSSGSSGNSLFLSRIDGFFSAMGQLLHLNSVFGMIAYPCSYVLNVLAFDLNTIQVPCPGSQAPINLLLDCFIAAVVLVLINSDSHLLWIARVQSAFFKWMPLLSSKRYVLNTLCSSLVAPVLNMIPFLASLLPSPMKISQFLISYVSISEFFSSNGHSRSSSNCDASAAIPIDTIEAYLTTILVVILIPPIIYLYAQVLFPSPMTIIALGGGGEMTIPSSFVSETWKLEADKWWRLVIAGSSVDWFLIKCLFNFGLSMLHMLQGFVVSVGRAHGQQREMEKFQEFFEDPLRGAALPDVAWLHALEYFEPHSDTEWQSEELKWQQQREQAPTYYSMIQVVQVDVLKGGDAGSSSSPSSWRWYMWSKWFSLVGCWIVPLQLVYSSEARRMWMAVVAHYGMYFLMSAGCWTDTVVEKLMLIEKFRAFKASILTVEDDPEVVQTMENPLYSRSSIFLDKAATIVSGGGGDRAFSRDSSSGDLSAPKAAAEASAASRNGDAKDMFVQYLSAMTSCRAVMWQIVPGMTAFALLAVDTSTCPMLVFSKRLGRYLPPLLAVNAWADARSQLETVLSASQQRPRSWQILLVAASLWMRGSRLVQFSLNLFANAITWYVIFSSEGLFAPACAFLGVQVCVGLVKFGRILVDIHRIFFLSNSSSHHDGGGDGDGKEDDRYSAKKLDFQ